MKYDEKEVMYFLDGLYKTKRFLEVNFSDGEDSEWVVERRVHELYASVVGLLDVAEEDRFIDKLVGEAKGK